MARYRLVWVVCIVACLQAGCQSWQPELSSSAYTVTAVIVEPNSILTSPGLDKDLESLLSRQDRRITCMPTVHLLLGEKIELNEQEPFTFPQSFGSDFSVEENKTVGIGKLVRVELHQSPGLIASVYLEDVTVTQWTDYSFPDGSVHRYPKTRTRSMGSDIPVQLGTWQLFGQVDGVGFFVRIDPPME